MKDNNYAFNLPLAKFYRGGRLNLAREFETLIELSNGTASWDIQTMKYSGCGLWLKGGEEVHWHFKE